MLHLPPEAAPEFLLLVRESTAQIHRLSEGSTHTTCQRGRLAISEGSGASLPVTSSAKENEPTHIHLQIVNYQCGCAAVN